MNKSVKMRKVSVSASKKPEAKNRNCRSRKKIKLVQEEEEEVMDEDVDHESENEVESVVSDSDNENESFIESDDEIQSLSNVDEEIIIESDEEEKVATQKRKNTKYNAEEEARLEQLVFGNPIKVINNLRDDSKKGDVPDGTTNLPKLPKLDESDDNYDPDVEIKSESEDENVDKIKSKKAAAWVDEDDTQYSVHAALKLQNRNLPNGRTEQVYTELLENKFTDLVGTPKWASLESNVKDEDEDSDNQILKHSTHLVAPNRKKLRKGTIDIKALTDINKSTRTEDSAVTSVQFHPTSTVALVAVESGILSLFQIDGRENNKLHSIRFEKFNINCAKFLKEGNEVIMGSRYKSCSQAYDLMSGKTYRIPLPHGVTNMQKFEVSPDGKWIAIVGRMGQIHLLSSTTKELVANFKMNKRCLALAFSPDSAKLITHGDTEEMYIWDLKSRSCLHKAVDDGCIASSAVAFSPSGQFVATGSKQGVVNIYDTDSVMAKRNPAPLKIILNLVTPITTLKFNPTSEILAMSSNLKNNAFKMVHIPSFTVFANFPTFQTKMYNPLDIDFSPSGGYLGLSNNKGHAYLYRLKHYGNY